MYADEGAMADQRPVPVTVLCGFLGSGKTTLLNHILTNKEGLNVALLVNDMASVNVDAAIVKSGPGGEEMVQLQNGCICCQLRGEMMTQVLELARRSPPPDAIVIEASGISRPRRIQAAFANEPSPLVRLDTRVTVIDAARFERDLASREGVGDRDQWVRVERALKSDDTKVVGLLVDQVECADVLVVNKSDLVPADGRQRVEVLARSLNPAARLMQASFGRVALREVLDTGLFEHSGLSLQDTAKHTLKNEGVDSQLTIGSFVYRATTPFHPERLHGLVRGWRSRRVVRSKGYVWVGGAQERWYYWSHAGNFLQLQDPPANSEWEGTHSSEVVVIGFDLSRPAISELFDQCLMTDRELNNAKSIANCIEPLLDPAVAYQQEEERVRAFWFTVAKWLAVFTIVWNVGEGAVSIALGAEDQSVSLIGFGADAIIEVLSAMLVLHRLVTTARPHATAKTSGSKVAPTPRNSREERRTAALIALLLVALALGTLIASIGSLATHAEPHETVAGIVVSSISLSWMCFLYAAKVRAAVVLQSTMLAADASCSLACSLLSLVLFGGSLLYTLEASLWFVDSATAIVIALIVGYDGVQALRHHSASAEESMDKWCCGGTFDSRFYQFLQDRAYTAAGTLKVVVDLKPPATATASVVAGIAPRQAGESREGGDGGAAAAAAVVEMDEAEWVDVDSHQDAFLAALPPLIAGGLEKDNDNGVVVVVEDAEEDQGENDNDQHAEEAVAQEAEEEAEEAEEAEEEEGEDEEGDEVGG